MNTLVLGGARSGKSAYAERLAAAHPRKIYLATAEPRDAEMRARIAEHKRRRDGWETVEEPLAIADVIAARTDAVILVDCLTLWLSNLMERGCDVETERARLCAAIGAAQAPLILVSNEVGLGIVPDSALAREFRDHAGRLNQRVAEACGRVVFMAAGLPLTLKGSLS